VALRDIWRCTSVALLVKRTDAQRGVRWRNSRQALRYGLAEFSFFRVQMPVWTSSAVLHHSFDGYIPHLTYYMQQAHRASSFRSMKYRCMLALIAIHDDALADRHVLLASPERAQSPSLGVGPHRAPKLPAGQSHSFLSNVLMNPSFFAASSGNFRPLDVYFQNAS
jgi:hypothetical protein